MPSPFPGMDPYLETPDLWPDVHHAVIGHMQKALNPGLRPRYVARVELRVYISDDDDPGREALVPDVRIEKPKRKSPKKANTVPSVAIAEPLTVSLMIDDEIKEARLEIRHLESGSLVTIIEVLSPTNKIRGARGRTSFMDQRRETMASEVHWVEIDLLRAGVPSISIPPLVPSDYRILVSRAGKRSTSSYWPVSVRQPLPVIGIPLREPDPDVALNLGTVLSAAYDDGAYDLSVDYRKKPDPPPYAPRAVLRKLDGWNIGGLGCLFVSTAGIVALSPRRHGPTGPGGGAAATGWRRFRPFVPGLSFGRGKSQDINPRAEGYED